jgi:hypothetical protein
MGTTKTEAMLRYGHESSTNTSACGIHEGRRLGVLPSFT